MSGIQDGEEVACARNQPTSTFYLNGNTVEYFLKTYDTLLFFFLILYLDGLVYGRVKVLSLSIFETSYKKDCVENSDP